MLFKAIHLTSYAGQKEERVQKALTRQQWIFADRVLMLVLFISVIAGTIIFS